MKKVLFVAVLATTTFIAQAQVKFGVKAGVNISNWGGKDADELDGKKSNTGFNIAGLANIPFSENFSFQPELQFSISQGIEFREAPLEVNYNLNYINVPLMLQFNKSGFFAEAGPQVGFLVTGKVKTTDGTNTEEMDVKDELNAIDFGVNLGAGYITNSGFGFGARYNFGMSNIIDQDNTEVKNRVFSINLIYMFGGKKSK